MKPYYQDGHAVLYCGDCVEVLPLAVRRCDAAVTDPPYVIPSMIASGRGIVRSVGDVRPGDRRAEQLDHPVRWRRTPFYTAEMQFPVSGMHRSLAQRGRCRVGNVTDVIADKVG